MGLPAAIQLLLGPSRAAAEPQYRFSYEDAFKRKKRGVQANLLVPSLSGGVVKSLIPEDHHEALHPATCDGIFRSNWRPTKEEAEDAAVDTFFSIMDPAFDVRETEC